MLVFITAIIFIALAFAGIAIKILVKKNGQFAGTCSSNNPMFRTENENCSICGAKPSEKCKS